MRTRGCQTSKDQIVKPQNSYSFTIRYKWHGGPGGTKRTYIYQIYNVSNLSILALYESIAYIGFVKP